MDLSSTWFYATYPVDNDKIVQWVVGKGLINPVPCKLRIEMGLFANANKARVGRHEIQYKITIFRVLLQDSHLG